VNLDARIERRRHSGGGPRLVRDRAAISPVAHLDEPVGRGSALERLLDAVEPVFDGSLPPRAYVWGPKGAGKSAAVSALFDRLAERVSRPRAAIGTSTRAPSAPAIEFVYVDARRAKSEFGLYRAVLSGLVDVPVPEQGVGTERLRGRLSDQLDHQRRAVVAVDHLGEPETYRLSDLAEAFAPFDRTVSWVGIGREPPATLANAPPTTVEVPAYQEHSLLEVLTERVSDGLARGAVEHAAVRRLAGWADGDAHDALAALLGAVDRALDADRDVVSDADVEAGIEAVPRPCVALGRVLALQESRQVVLWHLLDLDPDDRSWVDATAAAIAGRPGVDLSPGTVKRFLYELAEAGITERVTTRRTDRAGGRPPSRVEPRFSTRAFARLVDLPRGQG
jgi:Cdc6-like AAA superfamily ATPase